MQQWRHASHLWSGRGVCNPGKAMPIENGEDYIANAGGLSRLNPKTGRGQCGIRHGLEVVRRYRWCCEVTKGLLLVSAVNQVSNQSGVDRISRKVRKLVDHPGEHRGELVEEAVVEIKWLIEAFVPKYGDRLRRVAPKLV